MRPCNPRLCVRFPTSPLLLQQRQSISPSKSFQSFLHTGSEQLCRPSRLCRPWQSCTSSPVGATCSASTQLSRCSPWAIASGRRGGSSSSKSSRRWNDRQRGDQFARAAKVQGLKSRAAFKLLQINDRYRLFKPGMTVVDLGFAPGSWSQVAIDLTKPRGRVLGVDLLPVQPPRGVSTIQGDFLSPHVQAEIKSFLRDPDRGRLRRSLVATDTDATAADESDGHLDPGLLLDSDAGYIERERRDTANEESGESTAQHTPEKETEREPETDHLDRSVDVVLSDMSEPWDPLDGLYKRSISNPYYRLMNTSGNSFRDHAGSMDLCRAALRFSYDTLKVGGHFVCKFYQGIEDKALEKSLKAMFHKVHREKPESSRSESREAYFVGIKRLAKVDKDAVFAE
ncbi:23S rRNA (-2'-O)-methyltransferase [Capronia coronata CBS 617.96]|uniref:rRNA methyltransferase 2, mitochondrial n=1 Tax=Capronia coronata CBS 617.96 TaxID=1182541 RepID=W9Z8R5_9EURO|nr:23S rRNA (-2'-O)-methyltransferase [Capronia coronata CBS 617.96]EXJ90884.1 23S rRNA (-2'-O)-methyltransferase [Capronia coronata CBS 617.96]